MRRLRFLSGAGLSLSAAALALVLPARGDDWAQFRRDPGRSAASTDKVSFPLTDVWTWRTRAANGYSPLYHAVVRRGRVYFTAIDSGYRYLVCAELKTGKVHWRQRMVTAQLKFPVSDVAGPAVTASGIVYAYDWVPGKGMSRGQKVQSSGEVEAMSSFTVRTFDAESGRPGLFFPLATMGANGVLPRLSLTNNAIGQEVRPVPPTVVGCPP